MTGGLWVRLLSAAVLAPLVLLAVYLGGPYLDALILMGGAAMTFEWARLTAWRRPRVSEAVATAAVIGAVAAYALAAWGTAAVLLLVGALLVLLLQGRRPAQGARLALGVVYVGGACLSILWLRERPEIGLLLIVWLVALVWATDTAAYAAGRAIGGPRLAPQISPKKTWSGLIGGMVAAAAMSVGIALLWPEVPVMLALGGPIVMAVVGALLAVVEQAGDLLESALKRRAGVKDASGLIPGHGGVLDRCDGLLAVSLALALLVALRQAEV